MEALTTKIDSQFKDIKGEIKEMRDGCNSYGGPHPSSEGDDKPVGGPKEEEANYAYGGYQGGGYRGNYYGRSFRNWHNRQPREDNSSNPPIAEKKFDESDFEKTMLGFMNHQAVIQDLETKYGRLFDQCSSRPTGSLLMVRHIIHQSTQMPNGGEEADEAEKEVESSSSKQAKSDPPPLKAYKPKIPYPQPLRKEKMEEQYANFIDLIKDVRINVPFVDVLAGMPI
ncbi:hypothetical protein Tco_1524013 [Tanacetum coccineum]